MKRFAVYSLRFSVRRRLREVTRPPDALKPKTEKLDHSTPSEGGRTPSPPGEGRVRPTYGSTGSPVKNEFFVEMELKHRL
jgi:hypothetical protein